MIFRELQQSDVDFVAENTISRGFLGKQPQEIDFSYTLEHNGKILGIGGVRLITPTTGWGWFNMTTFARGHIVVCYRTIKDWLDTLVEDNGLKRVQAYIDVSFPEGIRMAKHLGFEEESLMKDFLPTGDAFLYVKIWSNK